MIGDAIQGRIRALFDDAGVPEAVATPRAVLAVAPAAKVTEVYNAWWWFACERQHIYFRRLHGEPAPWTRDDIFRRYRFTNAYRAAESRESVPDQARNLPGGSAPRT